MCFILCFFYEAIKDYYYYYYYYYYYHYYCYFYYDYVNILHLILVFKATCTRHPRFGH